MAQTFGKTWWGSEWLKSLTHIDYANRIPRGSAYARKGAVRSIDVNGNVITAKVSGSRPTPYRVTIRVPLFKKEQTELFMKKLLEQPALISKLLNRELDPEVFHVAKRIGLNLFPQRWSDLDMNCSCPDWAVPCKHLAAVIYMMSREIDNDPFLVFSMHGVDLLDELKKRNVEIEKEQVMDVPEMASLFVRWMPKEIREMTAPEFRRIDFSRLHDISEPLANLLSREPTFYPKGDFQNIYLTEMARMARNARRILEGKTALQLNSSVFRSGDLHRSDQVHFEVDADTIVSHSYVFHGTPDSRRRPYRDDFIMALSRLPDDYLTDFDHSVTAMHQALFCALHLLANGAVIPQIVKLKLGSYAIRWLPATIDSEVAQVVKSLDDIMPLTLMEARLPGKKLPVALKNQTECILSYLLGQLIPSLSASAGGDVFRELFFKDQSKRFDAVGETAIPGAIRSWLDRFFLSQRQYRPTLLISENNFGEFALDVAIERNGEAVLLKDILRDKAFESQRFSILKELSLLASLIRGLEMYINRDGAMPIVFTPGEFVPFLFETIPAIRLLGVKVMLPRSLQELIRPRVSMKISKKKQSDGKTYLRLDQMLQFDWQVALGDELISPDEFQKLIRRARGLIRFKHQYIYVTARCHRRRCCKPL